MSDTNRGEKGPGYEYWSRRYPGYFLDPGRTNKKRTTRLERREAKQECEDYEPIRKQECEWCGEEFDEDAPMWSCEWICHQCSY